MSRVFKPKRKLRDGRAWTSTKWWIDYTDETGHRRVESISTDKKVALSKLRKIDERVERIRLGLEQAPTDLGLEDLVRRYLADMALHLRAKTLETYQDILENLVLGKQKPKKVAAIRVKWVSELTPAVMKDYQARAAKRLSARSVNKHVTVLGTVLNWAVQAQLLRVNPIKGVRMLPSKPVKEQRALTDEEISELLNASSKESREVWVLFLHTGMRKREMSLLRWKDVDLVADEIHVRPEVAKSKRGRRIPMSTEVKAILQRRLAAVGQAHPDDVVLPTIEKRGFYEYVLPTFDRDLEAANIDKVGVHVHALRRTFATRLIRAGVDPKSVQTLLGHSTLDLTLALYTDARGMDLKGAVEKLGGFEVKEARPVFRIVA